MGLLSIIAVLLIIIKSLQWLWSTKNNHNDTRGLSKLTLRKLRFLPMEYVLALFITYIILIIGFGFIYTIMAAVGLPTLIEAGQTIDGSFFELLATGIYFSAVTLFSVGYGDITPVELGRWIAMIEALIGYLLPIAFVLRTFFEMEDAYFKNTTLARRSKM